MRIRGNEFVIGRAEGDIVIPHDAAISGRHVRIHRAMSSGRCEWHLQDLNSSNGTFVRESEALLKPGQELLIGSSRFRYDAAQAGSPGCFCRSGRCLGPQRYPRVAGARADAVQKAGSTVVELTPTGEGRRWSLSSTDIWLGRDAARDKCPCPTILSRAHATPSYTRIRRGVGTFVTGSRGTERGCGSTRSRSSRWQNFRSGNSVSLCGFPVNQPKRTRDKGL